MFLCSFARSRFTEGRCFNASCTRLTMAMAEWRGAGERSLGRGLTIVLQKSLCSCTNCLGDYIANVTHVGTSRQPRKNSEVPSSSWRLTGGPCRGFAEFCSNALAGPTRWSIECIIQTRKSNARRHYSLVKMINPAMAEWRLPRWRE